MSAIEREAIAATKKGHFQSTFCPWIQQRVEATDQINIPRCPLQTMAYKQWLLFHWTISSKEQKFDTPLCIM